MSNGDEETDDGDAAAEAPEEGVDTADAGEDTGAAEEATLSDRLAAASDSLAAEDPAEAIGSALDELEAGLERAETEDDLDEVEESTGAVADRLEESDLPEPEDDDEADPREELDARVSDLQDAIEERRGPYAEDAVAVLEDASDTVADTRWTEDGEPDVIEAVAASVDAAGEALDESFDAPEDVEGCPEALSAVSEAIECADLDPDGNAGTIEALIEATDALSGALEDAQEWSDLTTREQLRAEGFYDVLDHRKDFPPEWHAIKVHEKRGNAEMVLLALEKLGSEFMERHCLEALERMGPEEAFEPMLTRANRRDQPAIRILGKIGSEEALDTIEEYAGPDADEALRRIALKAVGEIGSQETTETVAQGLTAETESVRSRAARALGLIGDTRAIEPLAETLEEDNSHTVRASAAWALVQVGTERALETASEYTGDASALVAAEAKTAADAIGTVEA